MNAVYCVDWSQRQFDTAVATASATNGNQREPMGTDGKDRERSRSSHDHLAGFDSLHPCLPCRSNPFRIEYRIDFGWNSGFVIRSFIRLKFEL